MSSVPAESPPPIRRRMAPEARHQQLLDVAERLFVADAFATVSMEDIARAAGVTRPIVYKHFETKEGAYVACVRRIYERYDAALTSRIDPTLATVEQLRAGGDFYFSTLQADKGRWVLLFTSASVLTGAPAQELTAIRFAHIETIRVLLARAAPAAPPERLEASAHAISGAAERLGHWWLSRPDLSRDVVVDHYVSIVLEGLAPWLEH